MKVVLIGEPGVGKTSLIRRIANNKFDTSYLLTVGMDPTTVSLYNEDGIKKELILWDIAGQEQFRTYREIFYRGAQAAVGVFDLTRPESLPKLKEWIDELRKFIGDIPIILLANKIDLEDYISIPDEEITKFIEEVRVLSYSKTSAKTGTGVLESFRKLI